jgi:NADPH-dependent F420 reductase
MRIAIIGAGNVGGTLGAGWNRAGHEVTYGVRETTGPKADEARATLGADARLVSPAEAAQRAEVIVLCVPAGAAEAAVRSLGDVPGKLLIDATNPVGPGFTHALAEGSVAERIAAVAPGARVVKAFNTIGFNIMANPAFDSGPASLFMAGDDADAKRVAALLGEALGFEAVDCGPLSQARLLEHLALLWISMAMAHGHGRGIAFRLLRRTGA